METQNITVVFPDRMIGINGQWIKADISPSDHERVIQWRKEYKHIEYSDGRPNLTLSGVDFEKYVSTYVDVFEQEKSKQEELEISLDDNIPVLEDEQ